MTAFPSNQLGIAPEYVAEDTVSPHIVRDSNATALLPISSNDKNIPPVINSL
jgi:hypothetical protein